MIVNHFFEMALKKAKYQDKLTDRMQQIAQNWCLCMFCHLYNPNYIGYSHWKGELFDILDYLNNLIINDKNKKYKWSLEALKDIAEYDKPQNVFKACKNKFIREKELNIPQDKQIEICKMFSDNLEELANCLANEDGVLVYINKTFPEKTSY